MEFEFQFIREAEENDERFIPAGGRPFSTTSFALLTGYTHNFSASKPAFPFLIIGTGILLNDGDFISRDNDGFGSNASFRSASGFAVVGQGTFGVKCFVSRQSAIRSEFKFIRVFFVGETFEDHNLINLLFGFSIFL